MNEQAEFKTTYEGLINRTTSLESEIKAVVDAVGSLANSVDVDSWNSFINRLMGSCN